MNCLAFILHTTKETRKHPNIQERKIEDKQQVTKKMHLKQADSLQEILCSCSVPELSKYVELK